MFGGGRRSLLAWLGLPGLLAAEAEAAFFFGSLGVEDEQRVDDSVLEGLEGLLLVGGGGAEGTSRTGQP